MGKAWLSKLWLRNLYNPLNTVKQAILYNEETYARRHKHEIYIKYHCLEIYILEALHAKAWEELL